MRILYADARNNIVVLSLVHVRERVIVEPDRRTRLKVALPIAGVLSLRRVPTDAASPRVPISWAGVSVVVRLGLKSRLVSDTLHGQDVVVEWPPRLRKKITSVRY